MRKEIEKAFKIRIYKDMMNTVGDQRARKPRKACRRFRRFYDGWIDENHDGFGDGSRNAAIPAHGLFLFDISHDILDYIITA